MFNAVCVAKEEFGQHQSKATVNIRRHSIHGVVKSGPRLSFFRLMLMNANIHASMNKVPHIAYIAIVSGNFSISTIASTFLMYVTAEKMISQWKC